ITDRSLGSGDLAVAEAGGRDLHWDLKFDCLDAFDWQWADEPKMFRWECGDFIYVPPFTIHQHFNDHATSEARLIVISNRMVKEMRWPSTGSPSLRTRGGIEPRL